MRVNENYLSAVSLYDDTYIEHIFSELSETDLAKVKKIYSAFISYIFFPLKKEELFFVLLLVFFFMQNVCLI